MQFKNAFFLFFLFIAEAHGLKPQLKTFENYCGTAFKDLMSYSIAVVHKGQVVLKKSVGHVHEGGRKVNANTLYAIASSSKSLASLYTAYLEKQKKIDLETRIADIFEGVDERITLRHVLAHTSGYHNYFGNPEIEKGIKRAEILRRLTLKEVDTDPGAVFSYSNICFSLLEPVVKRATKKSFDDGLAQFLRQVGAKSAVVGKLRSSKNYAFPHRVRKVKGKDKKRVRVVKRLGIPPYYPTTVSASAGVYISLNGAIEVLKLMTGYKPYVLTREEIAPYYQSQTVVCDVYKWRKKTDFGEGFVPPQDLSAHYGLGWRTLHEGDKPIIVGHAGFINGVRAFFGFAPKLDLAVVIMVNQDIGNLYGIGSRFLITALKAS